MLKKILSQAHMKLREWIDPTVESSLGGVVLKVRKGTIRQNVDMDDAWQAFLVKDKNVIFDIGSNIGYFSLLSKVYGSPAHVVLVDPNPEALSIAASNLIVNGMSTNCSFVLAFVSDTINDKVRFYTAGSGAAGSIYPEHAKTAAKANSWFWAQTLTVDEIAHRTGLFPDFIKIDVEGAEAGVLNGISNVLKEKKMMITVEMHSNASLSMEQNATQVLEWCRRNSYTAWYLKEAEPLNDPARIADRGRCHLLLLPPGIEFPAEIRETKQGDPLPSLT